MQLWLARCGLLHLLTLPLLLHLLTPPLLLQLLRPWNPAFAIKFAHNQFFVMFQDSAAPSRLRSWVKRDIMSRRAHAHLQSCKRIVAARAADNGGNEGEWFTAAAAAVHKDLPHGVRTVFLNGAAYDLRMQRAVSGPGVSRGRWGLCVTRDAGGAGVA